MQHRFQLNEVELILSDEGVVYDADMGCTYHVRNPRVADVISASAGTGFRPLVRLWGENRDALEWLERVMEHASETEVCVVVDHDPPLLVTPRPQRPREFTGVKMDKLTKDLFAAASHLRAKSLRLTQFSMRFRAPQAEHLRCFVESVRAMSAEELGGVASVTIDVHGEYLDAARDVVSSNLGPGFGEETSRPAMTSFDATQQLKQASGLLGVHRGLYVQYLVNNEITPVHDRNGERTGSGKAVIRPNGKTVKIGKFVNGLLARRADDAIHFHRRPPDEPPRPYDDQFIYPPDLGVYAECLVLIVVLDLGSPTKVLVKEAEQKLKGALDLFLGSKNLRVQDRRGDYRILLDDPGEDFAERILAWAERVFHDLQTEYAGIGEGD